MKKAILLALILGLVAGSMAAPATAKKKKKRVERVVEITYTGTGVGVSTPAASGGICPATSPENTGTCIEVPITLQEKYVKVEIQDASGLKAPGYISQGDTDGDGIGDLYGEFCGAHEAPIPLVNSNPVRVSFYTGTCGGATPGTTTSGTIIVTLSNMP
jgi:hypothetical protein